MPEVLTPDDHDLIVLLATRQVLAHDDEDESVRVAKYIIRVLNDLRTETVKNLCNYIGDVMRYGSRPASGDLQDAWWNVWENVCVELDVREIRIIKKAKAGEGEG